MLTKQGFNDANCTRIQTPHGNQAPFLYRRITSAIITADGGDISVEGDRVPEFLSPNVVDGTVPYDSFGDIAIRFWALVDALGYNLSFSLYEVPGSVPKHPKTPEDGQIYARPNLLLAAFDLDFSGKISQLDPFTQATPSSGVWVAASSLVTASPAVDLYQISENLVQFLGGSADTGSVGSPDYNGRGMMIQFGRVIGNGFAIAAREDLPSGMDEVIIEVVRQS